VNDPTNSPPAPHSGPYETGIEATRATFGAFDVPGGFVEYNHGALLDACKAAGIHVGAYDHKILRWLSGWEPETVAVFVGLITRANADGEAGR
jgi:hypothetical protein